MMPIENIPMCANNSSNTTTWHPAQRWCGWRNRWLNSSANNKLSPSIHPALIGKKSVSSSAANHSKEPAQSMAKQSTATRDEAFGTKSRANNNEEQNKIAACSKHPERQQPSSLFIDSHRISLVRLYDAGFTSICPIEPRSAISSVWLLK